MMYMGYRSRYHGRPFVAVPILLSSLLFSLQLGPSLTIFFKEANSWGTTIGGHVHIDSTDFWPTCGWKIIMISNFPLKLDTSIDTWAYEQLDSYSWLLGNLSYNGDFSTFEPTETYISMQGNASYVFNLTWYCVCNQTTNGECQIVNKIPTVNDVSSVNNASHEDATSLQGKISRMAYFVIQEKLCYTGNEVVVFEPSRSLLDCGATCLLNPACQGINIHQDENRCDLVLGAAELPGRLRVDVQCAFWKRF